MGKQLEFFIDGPSDEKIIFEVRKYLTWDVLLAILRIL